MTNIIARCLMRCQEKGEAMDFLLDEYYLKRKGIS